MRISLIIAFLMVLDAGPTARNAAILHYTKNDETLKGKGLVCMDAGCEWGCYSSDVTRTLPISEHRWASKETAEIYAVVAEMEERCIEKLKPGILYLDLFIIGSLSKDCCV